MIKQSEENAHVENKNSNKFLNQYIMSINFHPTILSLGTYFQKVAIYFCF